jgi:hypothetical protein
MYRDGVISFKQGTDDICGESDLIIFSLSKTEGQNISFMEFMGMMTFFYKYGIL